MNKELYIGVMSGTSLDAVDIALCQIDTNSCQLIHSLEYPLQKEIKNEILALIYEKTTIQEVGELHIKLGKLFADAINALLKKFHLNPLEIKAIGLHGQTLWHQPNAVNAFSIQLGDANTVTSKTNITTISDFRSMDIANGGEGAPLAPVFHKFLFSNSKINRAVLNIGGMTNITLLSKELLGFDIGCGNVLLDYFINHTLNKKYDKDGEFAKSGKIDTNLLNSMLNDDYFKKKPPKSTGREYFNATWLNNKLANFPYINNNDIQRTLLELTAQTVAIEIKRYNIEELILCGGGAKNLFLVDRIKDLSGIDVVQSSAYGADGDFIEAMLFAWLAYKRLHKQSLDLHKITGSRQKSILGAIYEKN